MSMDLTGITNKNEYYTNHYFSTVFEENAGDTITAWNVAARESKEIRTPWSNLRRNATQFYAAHDRFIRSSVNMQTLQNIRELADSYLKSLGYPEAAPQVVQVDDTLQVPVYLEMKKANGAPLLWIVLMASTETDAGIMESYAFDTAQVTEDTYGTLYKGVLGEMPGEALATKILFGQGEPPRFLMYIGMNQIALIDRNKWNEKRYLQFELEEIFSRLENTTLQAMSVLLHKDSLCPENGKILLDELDEQSQRNASGVSQDLKYALRESIELLGNEVLYDMKTRLGRDLEAEPVDAGQLTLECLRYMYRMLFVLFIESRPELGYAPIKAQSYYTGYSLESLRDIADNIRDEVTDVGNGYYLHETLAKLYDLIYAGYPKTEEELKEATGTDSLHDMFLIAPLKAHIFDPEYTKMITASKLRNSCMLKIIELMSLTKSTGKKNSRRGRISYANLGINQMGAVYEALLSYRGFIAEQDLFEVKRAGDSFNELDVGYFVPESELSQYTEDERVRYESGEKKGKLRMYEKGSFIYRLAGREREKSASYYTPEVLTKCLVKYALKELLEGKSADDILQLTICEPAMGSAAFLNEAINQLAEAYVSKKEQETGEIIGYEDRFNEIQKVKMYIADRNVYGIDLNPVAVELAEVSLWLNTIHEGGFVPWFGTQLVNGNSLIGARRQAYRVENLTTSSKGLRWFELAPERIPVGTTRADKNYQMHRKQIYHFLLGDPGMCSYSDKVIKSLEPDNIKAMKAWNKKFNAPYDQNDIVTLLRLSSVIDELWEAQINLRREVEQKTQDSLSIFGHQDNAEDSHTTIRQKDKILSELYKSEHMRNAGPYARLKFAMDYWCALWFWPIDKADLLPSRSEFFFDMSLILEGTIASVNVDKNAKVGQMSLFPTEMEQMAIDIVASYGLNYQRSMVDIPALRKNNPRLDLAYRIAEQNKFMHWELEFADLFAEKGGFDLVIGNPPWIKIEWNEQGVLSDSHPIFAVKNLSASETAKERNSALIDHNTYYLYLLEYSSIAGEQSFLNATQTYPDLKGQQTNLFKCFLPQAWMYGSDSGVSAFVHPDGIYDDPKGGQFRKTIYGKLRKHFQFENELNLFEGTNDHGRLRFSLNIYCNNTSPVFDTINNLFTPSTIEECYDSTISGPIPRIKDSEGRWNIKGHPGRVIHISKRELELFAGLFDDGCPWNQAKLPVIHAAELIATLECFAKQTRSLATERNNIYTTEMWHEVNSQKAGFIERNIHFPESRIDLIYSGPHISVANPLFKASRRICKYNSDYDNIDLTYINSDYMQRCNYSPNSNGAMFYENIPCTSWGTKVHETYRIVARKMLNQSGERTLISTIAPKGTTHINGIIGFVFKNAHDMLISSGLWASLPYDFLIKTLGKANLNFDSASAFPLPVTKYNDAIIARSIGLNCITSLFAELFKEWRESAKVYIEWSKNDDRLQNYDIDAISKSWEYSIPLRSDYSRRQALVEIDVLTSLALGMTIDQLKTIYQIQFPVLQQYEADTWYDANGRIVFTNNRSLTGVGFERKEWENGIKGAPAGKKFYRTVIDDTVPDGPVERTIEYVAPFDRCDRELDYETAWRFFEEKYGKKD